MPFKKGDIIRASGCGARGNHGCSAMLKVKVLEVSSHTYPEGLPGGMTITGEIRTTLPARHGEFENVVSGL